MGQYREHVRLLVVGLFVLLGVLLLTALVTAASFQSAVLYSITLLALIILVLARFGGDLGPTQ